MGDRELGVSNSRTSLLSRILIIDDEETITSSLAFGLKKQFDVDLANSINQATEKLIKNDYQVILIDYDLNESIDGMELASRIKSQFSQIKIILMTGVKDFNLVKQALNQGNIDYIILKPLEFDKLLKQINLAIEKYHERQTIKSFLENPMAVENAQVVVEQLLARTNKTSNPFQLNGLVISHHSIPVFSHFYKGNVMKDMTDTLFAGFMNALVLVGDEVFSLTQGVESLVFGDVAIYFRFVEDFQISFVLSIPDNLEDERLNHQLDNFTDEIKDVILNYPEFRFIEEIYDNRILELLKGLKKRLKSL